MNKPWTRNETIVAFNLYCKIPFKSSSKSNVLVQKYASLLGRSASALNMKIGNIGRLDPDLKAQGISGLVHGAKLEEDIWNEFYDNPSLLAYESERIIAELQNKPIEESSNVIIDNIPQGEERNTIIKQRINQSFFRSTVLSSYNNLCCISGVGNIELLEACHIVGWADDVNNRTNPKNGLCLNSFFHKAYDKLLIGITPDLKIVISDELLFQTQNDNFKKYLNEINNKKIILPDKFFSDKNLLQVHYERYKNK